MTSSPRSTRSPLRAIDRLKKAANLEATKKEVTLSDGTVFEMWVAPLTTVSYTHLTLPTNREV